MFEHQYLDFRWKVLYIDKENKWEWVDGEQRSTSRAPGVSTSGVYINGRSGLDIRSEYLTSPSHRIIRHS